MSILVVDHEKSRRDLIASYLNHWQYKYTLAQDGLEAWSIIQASYQNINAIILEREIPHMSAMMLLYKLKRAAYIKNIPVIMQTTPISNEAMIKGLEAGIFYYVTQPLEVGFLKTILNSAHSEYSEQQNIQNELDLYKKHATHLIQSSYKFQRIEDLQYIVPMLASCTPDPLKVELGLHELLLNAIEHGNLEISYEEKTRLNKVAQWQEEINRRLELVQYKDKFAEVRCQVLPDKVIYLIKDQGEGFDWQPFLSFSEEKMLDNHGRGIALSNMNSFDEMKYIGCGNEVHCMVKYR